VQLESIYRSCNVVANVCIYAAPDESKPMAIIVPVEKALKAIATEKGITYENLHELVQNKIVQRIVLRFLQDTGKAAGLVGIDIVDRVVIVAEEWTPESVSIKLIAHLMMKLTRNRDL
jgi:long-chain acyl-CoA synthetase